MFFYRGIRFSICQTNKPPVAGTPGNPPDYIGNVTKLHASVHPSKQDIWQFGDESLNSDVSCFVRCSAENLYKGDGNLGKITTPDAKASPNDELYLFVELITSLRIDTDYKVTRNGIKYRKKEKNQQFERTQTMKGKDEKPEKTLNETTRSLIDGFNTTKNEDGTTKKRTLIKAKFINMDKKKKRGDDSDDSDVDMDLDKKDEKEEKSEEEESDEGKNDDSDGDEEGLSKKPKSKVVDVCCGWAMIPIAATLRGNIRKFKVDMCGGTPFGIVNIDEKEVPNRKGAWEALKRLVGYKIKSVLEIQINPLPADQKSIRASLSRSKSMPLRASSSAAGKAPETAATTAITNDPNKVTLIQLLPRNIVIPSSSVTIVGIYRKVLLNMLITQQDYTDRVLPQSGILHHADAILSSFPRIMADPASRPVLLSLWSKQFPQELHGKTYDMMTADDISQIRPMQVFRNVVLAMWHACSSPTAMPNRLNPFETGEEILARELRIRDIVGLTPVPPANKNNKKAPVPQKVEDRGNNEAAAKIVAKAAALEKKKSTSVTIVGGNIVQGSVADIAPKSLPTTGIANNVHVGEHLHTPFNARELLWKSGALEL